MTEQELQAALEKVKAAWPVAAIRVDEPHWSAGTGGYGSHQFPLTVDIFDEATGEWSDFEGPSAVEDAVRAGNERWSK